MSKATISYSLTRRPGQNRIAAAYQQILGERYEHVGIQDRADIVIVHHPPRNYETVYALHDDLEDRYVISACVAHASSLPPAWGRNLGRVQEVWTCSSYCQQVLSQYHPKVRLIPYVSERDFGFSDSVLGRVQGLVSYDPDAVYFLTIAQLSDPRKNVHTLVEAFKRIAAQMPKARLVVKALNTDLPTWEPHPQVLFLPFLMPDEYVSALYEIADVYASAHHSASWGLTISDAMLRGKPVMATGFSGNMDFMNEENSYPIAFHRDRVPAGTFGVDDTAEWAYPDSAALEEAFLRLYVEHAGADARQRAERGRALLAGFSRQRAAGAIYESIESALAA